MADDLGIMLTELPEAESISDNDLLYLVKENNSEKVKGLTLKNAVNKIQVPEVISTGDKACYVKRAIPTAGALAEGQKLIGATLAWNQLVQNGNFASTSGWSARYGTISVSNNICTMTPSSDGTQRGLTGVSTSETLVANHKYLLSVSIKPPINSTVSISFEGTNAVNIPLTANIENKCNVIWTTTSNTTIKRFYALILETLTTSQSVEYANVNAIDLTQLFGSTIADAIYQMEQTTAGSGVAFFRQYFSEDYYNYDAGSLQSVNVSAHKAYDSNATEISSESLDSSKEFRGLYKLIDGELRSDGDVYEADGTVTRKYGIVDIGSLSWTYDSGGGRTRFRSVDLRNIIKGVAGNKVANIISTLYVAVDNNTYYTGSVDKTAWVTQDGELYISNHTYTDAPSFTTAMSGVYLVYELATPTTESATPYTNPQLVDADGTEEFVDYKVSQGTRDVAIPVGHESDFYDYTDGAITIPDLPFADGTYALSVTMNNGTPTFSWESNS